VVAGSESATRRTSSSVITGPSSPARRRGATGCHRPGRGRREPAEPPRTSNPRRPRARGAGVEDDMRRIIAAAALVVPVVVATSAPAGACGGLVGENGTIELVRTTTLAAYSDGVERYVTAFEFTGEGDEVGSIIPLPDEPTDVTRAGN